MSGATQRMEHAALKALAAKARANGGDAPQVRHITGGHHSGHRRHKKEDPCLVLPVAPGTPVIDFVDRGHRHHNWHLRVNWTDVLTDVDGFTLAVPVRRYCVQIKRKRIGAGSDDPDIETMYVWNRVNDGVGDSSITKLYQAHKGWQYAARVRAETGLLTKADRSAWSGYSAYQNVTETLYPARNVTVTAQSPRRIKVAWDPPQNAAGLIRVGLDGYNVEFYQGATLKETIFTRSEMHRFTVDEADKGKTFNAKVYMVDENAEVSAAASSGNVNESGNFTAIASDGHAPSSSPTLSGKVVGDVGYIELWWTPLANPDPVSGNIDPVTYDIHISTASGFTPTTPGTWVGSTQGVAGVVTRYNDGTALVPGTAYYLKLVAHDPDGYAAAGAQGGGVFVKTAVSDGAAPTGTTPTPFLSAQGDFIRATWALMSNPDPMSYEVHVSTTTGFTPSSTTLYSVVDSSSTTSGYAQAVITRLPPMTTGGTALVPGTVYYVKVVGRDFDGTATPSAQQSIAAPGLTSDGAAPQQSPAVTRIDGGVGFLAAYWTPLTWNSGVRSATNNPDPTTYEVWAGTTNPPTTKVGETDGGSFFVRTIAGTSLKYGTTYYVGIKARDPDGTAAMGTVVSGVLKPADAVDLNANSVTALQILAGTITADKLSSNFVLGKKMVASSFGTDPLTGWSAHNRVEIDGTAGVSLVLDDGTTEVYPVRLPLDGTPAQFSGGVSASDLTVSGAMVLNGQVSSSPPDISQISPGAALSLQGSIQNPNAAPSATATWAPQRQSSDADTNYRYRGCDYSTTGGAAGTSQVYYVCRRDLVAGTWQLIEFLASTMVVNRVSTYYFGPDNEAELLDVCHVGTKVYVLVHLLQIPGQSEHWDVTVFDTTAFNTQVTTTTLAGARVNNKQPGLLYDGTNVGILSTNTTGGASRLKLGKLDNTTLAFVSDTLFDTAVTVSAPNTELYGGSRATNAGQSNTYVLGINDSTQSPSRYHNYTFDGTGLEIVSSRWDNPDADGASYVTYDTTNGRFVSMKESGLGAMWRHTDAFAYAANTNNVWFGYTFYDSNATGSQHETVVSTKVVGIQWTRRAYVNVTWPTPPILVGTDGVDNTRCYAVQSASSPVSRLRSAWQLQATVANPGTGLTLSAMAATAGTDTLGAFPSSNPGQITHQAGGSVAPLQGTGDGFLPVGMVVPFAGTVAPVGWLICDGAAVSRTGATANLFTVCGIAFGAGDGSTTFNIPDLKSRVPMGAGTFRARAANEGIAEASRDPGHTHGVGTIAIAQSGGSWANANISAGGALNGQGHAHANSAFSGATGAGGGTANFPSLGMNYIIKT